MKDVVISPKVPVSVGPVQQDPAKVPMGVASVCVLCGTTHVRVVGVKVKRRSEDIRREFLLLMFRCILLLNRRVAGAKTSLLRLAQRRHQRGRGMLPDVFAWIHSNVCHMRGLSAFFTDVCS